MGLSFNETARHFGIKGPCYTFTTACTSSANAFLYAASMVEKGDLQKALVIGYDLFNNTGFYGFESLRLTARSSYISPSIKTGTGSSWERLAAPSFSTGNGKTGQDFHYLGGATLCDNFNVTTHAETGDVNRGRYPSSHVSMPASAVIRLMRSRPMPREAM